MRSSTMYVSKNRISDTATAANVNQKNDDEIIQAGRILHDLLEVGPWRIDLKKLEVGYKYFDFSIDSNMLSDFITKDLGNKTHYIYRKCGEEIFIILNENRKIEADDISFIMLDSSFHNRMKIILNLLVSSYPRLANIQLARFRFPLAAFGQVQANQQFFPKMPKKYGVCKRNSSTLMSLLTDWRDGGDYTIYSKFTIYALDQKFSELPYISDYLAFKAGHIAAASVVQKQPKKHSQNAAPAPDYKSQLLEADARRCQLNPYPATMLEDSSQGHWDLYWPDGTQADEKWYKKIELQESFHGRNPAKDIRKSPIAIDFGTTGTVVAMRDANSRLSLLRIGAQGKKLREGVKSEHFVNPTVISIENAPNLLAAWHDLPWRPETSWDDAQCSHQALYELPGKIRSGLAAIKTWARGKCSDDPLILVDSKNNEISLPIPAAESEKNIAEDFASLPLNPIELYAYFLGLFLNNQMENGGRIFTEYYMTFPAAFERETRDRILDSFRRGLLRSLPPSLVYAADWNSAKLRVVEEASEPAAFAAAILSLLDEDGEKIGEPSTAPEAAKVLSVEDLRVKIAKIEKHLKSLGKSKSDQAVKKRKTQEKLELEEKLKELEESENAKMKPKDAAEPAQTRRIAPTPDGVAFGIFDFGGGTTDIAIGLYRLPTEKEEEEEGWGSVIDILDTAGDADLGGEELVRLMVFEVVRANMAKLLENGVIPFERGRNFPSVAGGEELFSTSVIARENSRKLGQKLRPIWEEGKLENKQDGTIGQVSETFKDLDDTDRKDVVLNVDVPALRAMIKEHIAAGVEKFFSTFGQAFKKHDLAPDTFHIILAGNSSQSDLVPECFREKIAQILKENPKNDKIVLHRPLLPNPADPEAVTLKTGVAIGLLKILPGEPMGMVNRQQSGKEAAFPFTLGPLRQEHLLPVLKRGSPYGQWQTFGKVFRHGICKFYYTDSPLATQGNLGREDCREGQIDWGKENFGKTILVRAEKPDAVVFALGDGEGKADDSSFVEYALK